ncbi:MAG TPA: hypothetical protein VMH40_08205 [Myxococcaceae bacterium]|nr:hypothetical protein [Myxococcaceae bacterium]
METLPINLTETVTAVMAMLIALIPVLGLVIRMAAKPVVEALLATKGEGARPADLSALRMRVEALEHEVQELSGQRQRALPAPVPLHR